MSKPYDCLMIGAAIIDVLVRPADASVFESGSYAAEQIFMQTGGDALNEATVFSMLGGRAGLVTKIGSDYAGEIISKHCLTHQVNQDYIATDPQLDTGINTVLVRTDGERCFITNPNGCLRKLRLSDIPDACLPLAGILSFGSIFVFPDIGAAELVTLFRKAKDQQMLVCADVTKPKYGETIRDLAAVLPYIDYLFPNYEEACMITGLTDVDDIADCFLSYGVKHIIIKLGRKGCLIKTPDRRCRIAGWPVEQCVDTTGAGDAFAAGFLYALSQNYSLEDCGILANCTASFAVGATGSITGIPSRDHIFQRYQEYKHKFR